MLTVVAIAVIAIVFGGGWVVATRFQSPAQRAAAAAPPAAPVLTSEVKRGDLAQTVNAQASVRPASTAGVPLTPPDGLAVVTGTPTTTGATVTAAQVVLEINGRPVIALPGSFRFYRDLRVGDSGPDVRQLQAALRDAGFSVAIDGRFGPGTEQAVRALYQRTGYPVPTAESPVVEGSAPDASSAEAAASNSAADAASALPGTFVPQASANPKTTAMVTAAELVVAPALPARLESAPRVGEVIDGDANIGFAGGDLIARADVAESVIGSITTKTIASLTPPGGTPIPARVTRVTPPAQPGDNGSVTLAPEAGLLDESLAGKSVLTTFTVAAIASDALIVPASAVQSHGDARFVLKREPNGDLTEVPVTEIGSLAGRSAVHPDSRGTLSEGDAVRTG
ncbi:peptidoglycan-binding protein [Gryllotalpicola reticulitermitis]|uniref:peptidoglycan-binding protein n=1 Tax=Gryllotalpicola reticulitermitis TaxID=1184153 RepID=UPI0036F39A99